MNNYCVNKYASCDEIGINTNVVIKWCRHKMVKKIKFYSTQQRFIVYTSKAEGKVLLHEWKISLQYYSSQTTVLMFPLF